MEILILALLGGLAYFLYVSRPTGRASSAQTREAAGESSPAPLPDDDDAFLRDVGDQLRRRRSDGE